MNTLSSPGAGALGSVRSFLTPTSPFLGAVDVDAADDAICCCLLLLLCCCSANGTPERMASMASLPAEEDEEEEEEEEEVADFALEVDEATPELPERRMPVRNIKQT